MEIHSWRKGDSEEEHSACEDKKHIHDLECPLAIYPIVGTQQQVKSQMIHDRKAPEPLDFEQSGYCSYNHFKHASRIHGLPKAHLPNSQFEKQLAFPLRGHTKSQMIKCQENPKLLAFEESSDYSYSLFDRLQIPFSTSRLRPAIRNEEKLSSKTYPTISEDANASSADSILAQTSQIRSLGSWNPIISQQMRNMEETIALPSGKNYAMIQEENDSDIDLQMEEMRLYRTKQTTTGKQTVKHLGDEEQITDITSKHGLLPTPLTSSRQIIDELLQENARLNSSIKNLKRKKRRLGKTVGRYNNEKTKLSDIITQATRENEKLTQELEEFKRKQTSQKEHGDPVPMPSYDSCESHSINQANNDTTTESVVQCIALTQNIHSYDRRKRLDDHSQIEVHHISSLCVSKRKEAIKSHLEKSSHVIRLRHRGCLHNGQTPKECIHCGHTMANTIHKLCLKEFDAQQRNTLGDIIVLCAEPQDSKPQLTVPDLGMIQGMRDHGLAMRFAFKDDVNLESESDVLENVILVTNHTMIHKLDKKVAFYVRDNNDSANELNQIYIASFVFKILVLVDMPDIKQETLGSYNINENCPLTKSQSEEFEICNCMSFRSESISFSPIDNCHEHSLCSEYGEVYTNSHHDLPATESSSNPIFSPNWKISQQFSSNGGQMQEENSDVILLVPDGAIQPQLPVTINGAVSVDLHTVHTKLRLAEDEMIASPVVEFEAGQKVMFQKPVKIVLPHFLPPSFNSDHVRVLMFHKDDVGNISFEILCKRQKSENIFNETEKHGAWFYFNKSREIRVLTHHFTGFVCIYCSQTIEQSHVYLSLFAIYRQKEQRTVKVCLFLWDKRLHMKDFKHKILTDQERKMESIKRGKLKMVKPDMDVEVGTRMIIQEKHSTAWIHREENGTQCYPVEQRDCLGVILCRCSNSVPVRMEWLLDDNPASTPMPYFECFIEVGYVMTSEKSLKLRDELGIEKLHIEDLIPVALSGSLHQLTTCATQKDQKRRNHQRCCLGSQINIGKVNNVILASSPSAESETVSLNCNGPEQNPVGENIIAQETLFRNNVTQNTSLPTSASNNNLEEISDVLLESGAANQPSFNNCNMCAQGSSRLINGFKRNVNSYTSATNSEC